MYFLISNSKSLFFGLFNFPFLPLSSQSPEPHIEGRVLSDSRLVNKLKQSGLCDLSFINSFPPERGNFLTKETNGKKEMALSKSKLEKGKILQSKRLKHTLPKKKRKVIKISQLG